MVNFHFEELYYKLVNRFIELDILGHYDPINFSICLYDITESQMFLINQECHSFFKKYKVIKEQPYQNRFNVNILDIEI